MKVLVTVHGFLTPSMTFVYNQVLAMVSEGHDVQVVTCRQMNTDIFPFENVKVIPEGNHISTYFSKLINRLHLGYTLYSAPFVRQFREVVQKFCPDVIHVHFGTQLVRIYPAVKDLNIPVITTFHGIDASRYLKNKRYTEKLRKIFQSGYIRGTTVAMDMKKRLMLKTGISESSLRIDYLGVDFDFFKRWKNPEIKNGGFVFLQVSNFVEKKGHQYTLAAFSKYVEKHGDYNSRLVLAGDGPLINKCRKLVISLGLKEQVEFVGLVDKGGVYELMNAADFFVHPSVTASNGDMEGLPTVIMEALSMDLPVISSYHAGIPEIIEHCKNGLLVQERDVNALAEMFYEIRELQGKNVRRLIKNRFNLSKNTRNILRIFEDIRSGVKR